MKQILFSARVRFIIIFFMLVSGVQSQTIEPPVIQYVSIDNATDEVIVNWEESPTSGIDSYEIYKNNPNPSGGPLLVATVDASEPTEYRFPIASGMQFIQIRAVKSISGQDTQSDPSDSHFIMRTSAEYDQCANMIDVSWNHYKGWSDGVLEYELYSNGNKINTVPGADSTATIQATPQSNYAVYVKAIQKDGQNNATALDTEIFADAPALPDSIYASATVNNGAVELSFTLSENTGIEDYLVERSRAITKGYQTIDKLSGKSGKTITYTDDNLIVDEDIYFYRLVALNYCGTRMKNSEIVNNIVLSSDFIDYQVLLNWNIYKADDGNYSYNIHRISFTGDQTLENDYDTTFYTDNVANTRNFEPVKTKDDGQFCYYVTTSEQSEPANKEVRSNVKCVSFLPEVNIPNAFTPNGDGKNDMFRVLFDFIPDDFYLVIYNRYGNKIFETTDPFNGWDGTAGGTKVQMGAYAYSLKYTAKDGRTRFEEGSVTVVYP